MPGSSNPESRFSPPGHMFENFYRAVRDAGVPASPAEWLDFQRLLPRIHNLDQLYLAGRTALVKSPENYAAYNEVFERLFGNDLEQQAMDNAFSESDMSQNEGESNSPQPGRSDMTKEEREEMEKILRLLEDMGKGSSDQRTDQIPPANNQSKKRNQKTSTSAKNRSPTKNTSSEKNEGQSNDNQQAEQRINESSEISPKKESQGSPVQASSGSYKGSTEQFEESNSGDSESDEESEGEAEQATTGTEGSGPLIKADERFSAKAAIESKEVYRFDKRKQLTWQQFGRALAKLSALKQTNTQIQKRILDAEATANSMAKNAGFPMFRWKETIETSPKVLVLFDVWGSTDIYQSIMEKLFSALKQYVKDVEILYYHNALFGEVWPQEDGEFPQHPIPLEKLLTKNPKTKLIIVSDAMMPNNRDDNTGLMDVYSPRQGYDPNRIAKYSSYRKRGYDNFRLLRQVFQSSVWINPILEKQRELSDRSGTIKLLAKLFPMFDLSLAGLEKAVEKLKE